MQTPETRDYKVSRAHLPCAEVLSAQSLGAKTNPAGVRVRLEAVAGVWVGRRGRLVVQKTLLFRLILTCTFLQSTADHPFCSASRGLVSEMEGTERGADSALGASFTAMRKMYGRTRDVIWC